MRTTMISLALIAASALAWAVFLEPYKSRDVIAEAMTLYPQYLENSRVASEKYWAARDSQLTQKFALQDYGLTALTLLIALTVVRGVYRVRRLRDLIAIRTPVQRWKVILLGITAAFLTTSAYVLSLMIDASRDAFPPWADSLGIPLAGVPVIFVLLISIAMFFGLTATLAYGRARPVRDAFMRNSRPPSLWLVSLGTPLVISGVVLLITALAGDFVFLTPVLLWFVFFAFLFAAKQQPANFSSSGRDIGATGADARRST